MRTAWRSVMIAICLTAPLAVPESAWAHPLEVVPADDPVYETLYRLASRGLVPLWAASARPVTRLDLARMVARSLDLLGEDRGGFTTVDLGDLERLVLDFSDELFLLGYRIVEPPQGPTALAVTGWGTRFDRALVTRIESGVPPWYEPAAGGWLRLDVSEVLGFGPSAAGGAHVRPQLLPVPDATGALERLYLSMAGRDVSFRLGHDSLWWGPGWRGAFLLSDHAGALDYLTVSMEWERLRAVKLLVPLSLQDGRYLYGLRVDWLPTDTLRLGLGESVVGSGGIYLPYLLNPFPFVAYFLSLWVNRQGPVLNDNYNFSLDADWRLGYGSSLYAEVYGDDVTQADNPFPSRLGGTIGLLLDPIASSETTIRLEHSRATNWLYTTGDGSNDYVRNGTTLGHWCAPDCEMWSAEVARRLGSGAVVKVGHDIVLKGEGQLGQTWSGSADAWARLYLSGVVETTRAWRAEIAWSPEPSIQQRVGIIWSSAVNASHVVGQTRQDWFVWWEAKYEF